jgi:hypothetical protein
MHRLFHRLAAALIVPLLILAAPLPFQLFRCAMDGIPRRACCCHPGEDRSALPKIESYCCDIESVAAPNAVDRHEVGSTKVADAGAQSSVERASPLLAASGAPVWIDRLGRRPALGPPLILLKRSLLI